MKTKLAWERNGQIMQLNCSATNCIHNRNENCFAHVIQVSKSGQSNVGKNIFCNTYSKDVKNQATAVEHMGYPTIGDGIYTEEYAADFVSENPNITCNASKCAYNKDYECNADRVCINAPHGLKCECETFCLE